MANKYGYTAISAKTEAHAELVQWQLTVQHTLGRRVNLSDALRMAIATAETVTSEGGTIVDPT